MKKVLYATNCNEISAPALRHAYRLSSAMNAQLHVLHIYTVPPLSTAIILPPEKFRKRIHREQQEILSRYCDRHLKHELLRKSVITNVVEGDTIADAIALFAAGLMPDLLIVGMKDRNSLRGFFSGNVANQLLNKINIPLLIVPHDFYYHGLATIIYATDFEEADIFALENLVTIAEPYGALIKVVHVPLPEETDAVRKMKWFKRETKQRIHYPELVFSMPKGKNVETGLVEYIRKEQADMLVMLEREHAGILDRLFHKDLVRAMESEISIPLLAFNEKGVRLKTAEQEDSSYSLAYG